MREKILFVCIENACRSQLEEAICNNLFSDQLIAYSAGSKPGTEVNPKAIKSLKSIGIILEPHFIAFFLQYPFFLFMKLVYCFLHQQH